MFGWIKKLLWGKPEPQPETTALAPKGAIAPTGERRPELGGARVIFLPGPNIRGAVHITALDIEVAAQTATIGPVPLASHPDVQALLKKGYLRVEDFDPAQARIEADPYVKVLYSFYRDVPMYFKYVEMPCELKATENRNDKAIDRERPHDRSREEDQEECPVITHGWGPSPERALLDRGRV